MSDNYSHKQTLIDLKFMENVYHWSKFESHTRDMLFPWAFNVLLINSSRCFINLIFHFFKKVLYRNNCVKSVRIRSCSRPHFPAFGPNTERYRVSLRIQSKCGKMRTRITPNTDTFCAVQVKFCRQRFIENSVKHLRWKDFQKKLKVVHNFCKNLYLTCLTEFSIHIFLFLVKLGDQLYQIWNLSADFVQRVLL